MNKRRALMLVLVLLVGGVSAVYYYNYQAAHPSTSDAYLGMHVVELAPQVSGSIVSVAVHSHQSVRPGDLLFQIDPKPYQLAVDKARADLRQARQSLAASESQVSAAQAQMDAAQATWEEVRRHSERILDLVAKGTVSRDQGDEAARSLKDARESLVAAQAELSAAKARRGEPGDKNAAIEAAKASLSQALLNLQHTRVVAPGKGILGEVNLRQGSFVGVGQSLFALVETDEVWVDANFKETDLLRIQPGQSARIQVDLKPGRTFKGQVESLSPASGSAFSLLPPENATGNWVKVTQRFPVRIRLLDPAPDLRLGASSEVSIDTTLTQ
ncbi:MAG: HlyD family secretion protein [Candidatus Thiodiazotropha sp.]